MLFSDYGSQNVGMGKELYDNSRLMQEYFEEAFNCLNINFVKLCFASSDAELAKIENAYVSLFLVSVATAALLKQENIIPDEVAGYGIGEISAVCVAGGLSLPDGLYFLNKYALFYQELLTNLSVKMLRVEGISTAKVDKLCKELSGEATATIAVFEAENQSVISGHVEVINRINEVLTGQAQAFYNIPVEQGLHNELMDPVVNQIVKYLEKIDFKNLMTPLFASVDGVLVSKKELVKRRIIKQLHAPIYWNKVLNNCNNWDLIIEVGPSTALSKLIKQKYPDKLFFSVNKFADIEELKKVIAQRKSI